MPVTIDAIGPGPGGDSTAGSGTGSTVTLSWTHPGGSAPSYALVQAAVSQSGNPNSDFVTAVTFGGASMTQLAQVASGSTTTAGYTAVYYLARPPAGSQTVTATCTVGGGQDAGDVDGLLGASVTFNGAGSLGTAATGSSSGAVTSGSISITGTTPGNYCLACIGDGSGDEAWTAGTQQWLCDHDIDSGAGNISAATLPSPGGTATLSWTMASDTYAAIGVEVQAMVAGPQVSRQLPNFPVYQVFAAGRPGGASSAPGG